MSWKISNRQIPPPPENENEFENLCLDLYTLEFGDGTQKNGSRGQVQNGVDIFNPDQHIGIQCKKKEFNKKVTDAELHKEVKKAKSFEPSLKKFILATTNKRDAKLQKLARLISEDHKKQNLFSVQIHSWDEIKSLFEKYPRVYKKYYPESVNFITPDIVSSIQSDSRHQELNTIGDLIKRDNKPKTALNFLEKFKNEKWEQLEDKEKYRVLTYMGYAKIDMKQEIEGSKLLIEALSYKPNDEDSKFNCALAYYIINDIKKSTEYINKLKQKKNLNLRAFVLEIQIKDKEKQSLSKIISSLPQSLKTEYQIARILLDISIKRKDYKEAEKWLNILDTSRKKDENSKNVIATAHYADMSLSLILGRQDVFSGRRVPDSLKNKLEEIITIYENLITKDKYHEIKKFNPNWYFNYALALELNGDLDNAISILEEGIRNFPKDDFFKIALGRLFLQKGDIKKNISILENHLGLQILKPKDCFESADNTVLDTNQMNLSDKTFHLALTLTDLYLQNNQQKNAYKLLNIIEKSEAISEEDKLESKQYKIFRLINFEDINKAEQLLKPLFQKDEKNIMNLILYSKISSVKESLSIGETSKIHKEKKIQYLKTACDIFKKYAQETFNEFDSEKKDRLKDIQSLFQELYFVKMYEEAEELLEEITNNNLNHPDIFKLLHIYFENGKNNKAIELAIKLFKKFPKEIKSVNILFLIYENLGKKKKAIQYYEKFFEKNPENKFIRIELALAYISNKEILKAQKILEDSFNLNQLSAEQVSRLSFSYMKTGATRKALETLYKYIKRNPNEIEPQNAYFSAITIFNHQNLYEKQDISSNKLKSGKVKLDKSFLHPKKVEIDCYVQIQDIENSQVTDIIIEENTDIYTPDHKLSKALLSKKKGEIILFQGQKYQIVEIQSKYVHKYQEIMKETEKKFPSKKFLKTFSVPDDADGKKLLQIFKKNLATDISKQYEALDKLLGLYNEGKVTVGFIAKICNKHTVEIIEELIFSKKYKFISAVPQWDDYKKTKEILNNKINILTDLSSLIVIHQLQIDKYIEKSKFKFYVCQSTIDSLEEYIREIALHSKDGRLNLGFDRELNPRTSFIPAEIIKKNLNFWMKVKVWAENYCSIKSLSEDYVLSRKERSKKENILGKDFFDSLLAVDHNFIFLSEDALLRRFAEIEYSISGIRLFDLIKYFEKHMIIDKSQSVKFKAQLVRLNQTYIPIDHNILLELLESADSVNDIGFQRALYFLSPVSDLKGVVNVVAKFLIEICQSSSLLPYRKQVIVREILDKISCGRRENARDIANQVIFFVKIYTKLLPFLQNEIERYIKEWLKVKIYY
ncbi:MAG: hypothetical protein GDA46_00495 [Bdellovibrionales bacterium]|nr:hypothetical protein [Bdellovibrionales bacterium]